MRPGVGSNRRCGVKVPHQKLKNDKPSEPFGFMTRTLTSLDRDVHLKVRGLAARERAARPFDSDQVLDQTRRTAWRRAFPPHPFVGRRADPESAVGEGSAAGPA